MNIVSHEFFFLASWGSFCGYNQLDGECRIFSSFLGERENGNSYAICSVGTCSEGDCENGKGTLSFPAGSKIKGTFKKGKINGAGFYEGCGSSYTGTFKDSLKDKGVLITKDKSNRDDKLVQYYDGLFKNEMRNGKGIYYSSENYGNKIYEGAWKDDSEQKNGVFMVYSGYTGTIPLSENGIVFKSSYDTREKKTFIDDIDKEEIEKQERDEIQKNKCLKECSYWENERISRSGRLIKDEGYKCRSRKCEIFMDSIMPRY